MGLQKGDFGFLKKSNGKIRERILFSDQFQNGISQTDFHGFKSPLPLTPMLLIELFPALESRCTDLKSFADLFYRRNAQEICCQHAEYEEQAMLLVGYDGIKQDGVCGATAGADHTKDPDLNHDGMTGHKVYEISTIIGKNMT